MYGTLYLSDASMTWEEGIFTVDLAVKNAEGKVIIQKTFSVEPLNNTGAVVPSFSGDGI